MRSIRFLLLLPALCLAACGGGGSSEEPAPIRLPAQADLAPAALELARGDRVQSLQISPAGTLALAARIALPETVQLQLAEAEDGTSAQLLLAAGADSRLLHLTGLPDAPRLQGDLALPGARDLESADASVYVLSASTLHQVSGDVLMRSIALPTGSARSLALSGAYAYIAAGADGLLTVDLDVVAPEPISANTATAAIVEDVAVAGDFLYTAEGVSGLGVFDISEGDAIVDLGNFNLLDCLLDSGVRAVKVLVRDNLHYLYLEQPRGLARVAVFDAGLRGQQSIIVQVSGLAQRLSCQVLPFALQDMELADDGTEAWLGGNCCGGVYALAAAQRAPLRPQVQGLLPRLPRVPGPSGRIYSADPDRHRLQVSNYGSTTTTRTAASGVVPVSGTGLQLLGEDAYVVHPGGVVRVGDVGTQPQKTAEYLRPGLSVIAANTAPAVPGLYAGFDSGARLELWRPGTRTYTVVSTSTEFIAGPSTSTMTLPGVGALLFAAGALFVADSTGHVQVLREAGTAQLRAFALTRDCGLDGSGRPCIRLPGPVRALAYRSPHLYAGGRDGSVHVLRVSTDALTIAARLQVSTPGPGEEGIADIVLGGNFAYVAAYGAGIHVLDISAPSAPRLEPPVLRPEPAAFDLALWGGLLYVAAGSSVEVYELGDPAVPVHLPALRVPGFAFTIAVSAGALHILERYGWRDYYRVLAPRPQP